MIAVVDYGLGNVRAFANVYTRLNIPVIIARDAEDLRGAERIVLPGVGAFDHAMDLFTKSGMKEELRSRVLEEKVPVLGVCVGMQILAHRSEEGDRPGLGWIDAEVKRIQAPIGNHLRVPHMGWNNVRPTRPNDLMTGITDDSAFYFLHSYYFHCVNEHDVLGVTNYGSSFACVVASENVYGVQFHPEKSHEWGVKLLGNFARI